MLTDLKKETTVHVKNGNTQYLQFKKLLEYKDIINHAYSLGTNVNFRTAVNGKAQTNGKQYRLSRKSYKNICNALGCKYKNIIKPMQYHTNNVKVVDKKVHIFTPDFNIKKYKETDGLITNKKNMVLSTTNADCILFLLFDPVKKVIANVHSGWKGTLQKIIVQAINKMVNEFGCEPKDIICCICPSIRKCHFEVSKDVKDLFEKEIMLLIGSKYIDDNGQEVIIQLNDIIEESEWKSGKWHIDTVLMNKVIMQNMGLLPENIEDSGICSVCNSDLIHSYRSEKQGFGLETAIIELK